ncbi:MAG: hypothetical protein A2V70_00460 [Planctomycetes bacterium RBG_13_63_9]|nr:MAG: hypothetical protein A2V70_00460 [Planctomycetes bacterium RBG_13_63_9]
MSYRHGLQASRFEFKFIVDEASAEGIRNFIRAHLEPDEHTDPGAGNAYPVNSLYLDSPDLVLFQQTASGLKNRFKLRIRFYDSDPRSPAFLEIKRRTTDVILKERAALTRAGVRYLLDGGLPNETHLVNDDGGAKAGKALQNFYSLYDSIDGCAQIYVCYMREAYVSPDSDKIRVTFDRQLMGSPFDRETCLTVPLQGTMPDVGGVVLEMKFTDRFPTWMQEMVEQFNLQRRSVPKYNLCVKAMGRQPWHRDEPSME